jgi:hypothetical protein
MAEQDEVVFRQRRCRACNAVFVICRPCDRGQRYCSSECRIPALRQQRRRANRRHQHSPEGRLDHRDRQRQYRQRCAQRRVTDTSSQVLTLPGTIARCPPETEKIVRVGFSASALGCRLPVSCPGRAGEHRHRPLALLRCVICGRSGRFIDPFPPSWGRRRVDIS